MRETQFIKQNEEKWSEFEQTLKGEARHADQLRDLFVHITDDLSYSRTFYPNRSVRVYLNGLAQRIFLKLYRSRRTPFAQLLTFWSDELPREIYEARQAFRLAFWVFVISMLIGMVSCAMDAEFAQVVLGDSYVEMTRANIESGDPMAVYKQKGQFGMFLGITFNNLFVAFLAFSMGVFFGVGSLIILISNAIMVGCFQYFFIQEGLFWESFLTIWIHGTLEISAIVIASAAGITMGQGPAFPGTYTRLQAFQRSARRGAKIMLGTTPLFIIAGFLEGYLTRQTETPDMIRGLFILICLGFVLIYFVWYPWFRNRLGIIDPPPETQRLPAQRPFQLDTSRIKANGEIFGEVFSILRKHSRAFTLLILGAAALYTALVFMVSGLPGGELYPFIHQNWAFNMYNFTLLYSLRDGQWIIPVAGGAMLYALAAVTFSRIDRELDRTSSPRSYINLFVGAAAVMCCAGHSNWLSAFLMSVILPFAMLYAYTLYVEPIDSLRAIGRTFSLVGREYLRLLGMGLLLLVLGWTLFSITNSQVADLFFRAINWLVSADQSVLDEWSVRLTTFLLAAIANFIWVLLFLGFSILYYSLREIKDATHLRERIAQVGRSNKLRGLERE